MTTIKAIETEYARIHYAARKSLGTTCVHCGSSGRLHAALRPETNVEKLKVNAASGCLYSMDTNDYHALCIACHRRLDLVEGRPFCRHGHPYTVENTSFLSDGSRRCLVCHRQSVAKRLVDPKARAKKRARDREYRARTPLSLEQKARKLELQRTRRNVARSARFEHGEMPRVRA